MQVHKNGKGKTACRIKPEAKEVEVVRENWKVLVRFNPDDTADTRRSTWSCRTAP